jgi:hypothetical protein
VLIKDLGKYQLINNNFDEPISIGTPERLSFSFSIPFEIAKDKPSAENQPNFIEALYSFIQNDIISSVYDELGDGVGVWWYLEDYDISFTLSVDKDFYLMKYKINVFRVYKRTSSYAIPINIHK